MSDHDALLAAVIAHRDEDTPRLMYADWCDENGEYERAEFIRVQVEVERKMGALVDEMKHAAHDALSPYRQVDLDEGIAALRQRERELLESGTASGWFAEMGWAEAYATDRGFAGFVTCTAAGWLARGAEVRRRHPVTRVRLTTVPTVGELIAAMLSQLPGEAVHEIVTGAAGGDIDDGTARDEVASILGLWFVGVAFELPA